MKRPTPFLWNSAWLLLPLLIGNMSWAGQLPVNLKGLPVNPLDNTEATAIVLLFVASECPISNRYAPQVNRIYEQYKERGIQFFAVYPDSSETKESIESHRKDFGYTLPALIDKHHFLVNAADAMVTPEACVYLPDSPDESAWIYRGRINDLYLDFGKWRHHPSQHDLVDTLDGILEGKNLIPRRTRAIGCYIEEL